MSIYLYRSTQDKLPQHVADIESQGDHIEHYQFVGGRDWTLVCRKGGTRRDAREFGEAVARSVERGLFSAFGRHDNRIERAAERGTRQGGAAA